MKKAIAFMLCLALIFAFVPMGHVYGGDDLEHEHDVVVVVTGEGSVSYGGIIITSGSGTTTTISATKTAKITITPESGYYVSGASVKEGQGSFLRDVKGQISLPGEDLILTLDNYVEHEATINIDFAPEDLIDLLTTNGYAVATTNAVQIKSDLANEFAYLGYKITPASISVSGISAGAIKSLGYGTFDFQVTTGGGLYTKTETGYIVETGENVLFKYVGTKSGLSVGDIRVVTGNGIENNDDIECRALEMDEGTIQLIGVGNFGVEGLVSEDVKEIFLIEKRSLIRITDSFYRAQLHLGSSYKGVDKNLSWLKFYLVQDDAFCVKVSATTSEGAEEVTWDWALNRYVDLTLKDSQSDVYFANDVVTLSLPSNNAIGDITTLSAVTGEFTGYSVTTGAAANTVKVTFLSNFYDKVDVKLIITDRTNTSTDRGITINRVGVYIDEYEYNADENNVESCVNHGTQPGSKITFSGINSGINNYKVYATYYIPHYSSEPAYGLYATYTWADGSTSSEIITKAALEDSLNSGDRNENEGESHSNVTGVFTYKPQDSVSVSDYLIYGGTEAGAPVSINVTVLKAAPEGETFGGVTFGSGLGVTWNKK